MKSLFSRLATALSTFLLTGATTAGLLTSCGKAVTEMPAPATIQVSGVVTDENGLPLPGAKVTTDGGSTVTAADGSYTLPNAVYHSRVAVSATAPGFFTTTSGAKATANQPATVNARLLARGIAAVFSASTGSTITNAGGQLTLLPNTVADSTGTAYAGSVRAYTRFLATNAPNFTQLMPGGDFQALNAAGEQGMLTSFGFFVVELVGSAGQYLNLRAGARAAFVLPLSSAQAANPRTPAPPSPWRRPAWTRACTRCACGPAPRCSPRAWCCNKFFRG